ncbi:MAG: oxygenase MpaB family protein, partial [Marmoricola sp.]
GRFGIWLSIGTFPPEMREILELEWSAKDERRFLAVGRAVRIAFRMLPERARYAKTPYLVRRLEKARAAGRSTERLQSELDERLQTIHGRQTKALEWPEGHGQARR